MQDLTEVKLGIAFWFGNKLVRPQ